VKEAGRIVKEAEKVLVEYHTVNISSMVIVLGGRRRPYRIASSPP